MFGIYIWALRGKEGKVPFEKEIEQLKQRQAKARQMGGPDKIKKLHERGKLTARKRIDCLLGSGTFLEVGLLNHSDVPRDGRSDSGRQNFKIGFEHAFYARCGVASQLKILTYERVCSVFDLAWALPSGIIHTPKADSTNYR